MATREQLKAAQAAEELEQALEAAARDKEALTTAHREELRVKELILADLSSQLVQARQALSTAQEGAKGASAARDVAERETAACREAREALRASEAKRERLETALEELEAARAEATADAEHAWQQVSHKEGMLAFVEREVHQVKVLFADKEQQLQAELRERSGMLEAEARQARAATAEAEKATERERQRADEAERQKAASEAKALLVAAEKEAAAEQLSARVAELASLRADKERLEGEMRLVLRAMDQQKTVAQRNMAQLSRIYSDWHEAVNA